MSIETQNFIAAMITVFAIIAITVFLLPNNINSGSNVPDPIAMLNIVQEIGNAFLVK